MRFWIRSWYRSMFNPQPMVGQTWDLDGIGLVTVSGDDNYGTITVLSGANYDVKRFRMYGRLRMDLNISEASSLSNVIEMKMGLR